MLWLASLIYPGFVALRDDKPVPVFGLQLLLGGWMGPFAGQVAWYANPLFWYAHYKHFIWAPKSPRVLATIAMILALTAPLTKTTWFHEGYSSPIVSIGLGQVLWLTSILVLNVLVFIAPRQLKSTRKV